MFDVAVDLVFHIDAPWVGDDAAVTQSATAGFRLPTEKTADPSILKHLQNWLDPSRHSGEATRVACGKDLGFGVRFPHREGSRRSCGRVPELFVEHQLCPADTDAAIIRSGRDKYVAKLRKPS